jgi:hypothetical protein
VIDFRRVHGRVSKERRPTRIAAAQAYNDFNLLVVPRRPKVQSEAAAFIKDFRP